ncbi:MAG: exodeoxyribonuclease VII large subunit [Bacteroidota bacterium]
MLQAPPDVLPLEEKPLTVSELARRIKFILESSFDVVLVQGEISNIRQPTSGHYYFTLKDEESQLQAVLWRSRVANLFFTPRDGMKVIARGRITVYEVRGQYQLEVIEILPAGKGELQIAFEQLKAKLFAEGLFDPAHKKPLPPFPERIGVVTSITGAAFRDIVSVLRRRFPALEIIIRHVPVQGEGAAEEIVRAIEEFNAWGEVDVLIVGRGGGSIEDLWAFNEEIVARAIYNSRLPIVSAVGHEIDFTIADFVADVRAPTPSAAAEIIIRSREEFLELLRQSVYTIDDFVAEKIQSGRRKVETILGSYAFNQPRDLLRNRMQYTDDLLRRLGQGMNALLERRRLDAISLSRQLSHLSPDNVLQRGYAMVRLDGEIIPEASLLSKGNLIEIQFRDGFVDSTVNRVLPKQVTQGKKVQKQNSEDSN